MPLYDYECTNCKHLLEDILQNMSEEPLTECPNCGKDQLIRVVTGGIHVFVKGSSTPVDIRKEEVLKENTEPEQEPKKEWYHSHGSASATEINKMTKKQQAKYIMEGKK